MSFQVLFSGIKNRKDLTQSPSSEIKRTKLLEKHKASREQENCSVEPRITEHRLQVLNEVKQLFRLNSYTIIRSYGVILEDYCPSRLKTRSRRSRKLVPSSERSTCTL